MVKKEWVGAGEMAQWESACCTGVETWSKIPNTHRRTVHGSTSLQSHRDGVEVDNPWDLLVSPCLAKPGSLESSERPCPLPPNLKK